MLVSLYELDKAEDALQVLFQVASMLTGFIRRDSGDESVADLFPEFDGLVEGRNDFYKDMAGLSPGDLRVLAPGDSIEFAKLPDIGANFLPWLKNIARKIAASPGITYEEFTGDLEGVNYSSIRAGANAARRGFEVIQRQLIVQQFCRPCGGWWMDAAVASGALKSRVLRNYAENRRQFLKIEWVTDSHDYVDPVKEVAADIMEIDAGLASRQDKIRSRSRSIEDVDRERKEDADRERENGLDQPVEQPNQPANRPNDQNQPQRQPRRAASALAQSVFEATLRDN